MTNDEDGQATMKLAPYLCMQDTAAAIDFYTRAFGAVETLRMTGQDGGIGHAEIRIGAAAIMLSDEWLEGGVRSATSYGGSPVSLSLTVPDVDGFIARAVEAGATIERPIADQPFGDRLGWLVDPFGYRWAISTPVEAVSKEELQRRVGDMYRIS